ncbi:replication restart helicase PriA [Rhizosphaericola mali]|uniref:Replication restart protein PriA n=1 Tax=Rhizosphaericola mali TaxID=2545455 RepID=A0A5P2G7Y9_9BACT|nr:primosomal protein N' [Rhizosphaericola mali]QES89323.1 primosomal protein N' [Rhizosphaericola mali]
MAVQNSFSKELYGEILYAEVIVPLHVPKNYTWSIPPDLNDRVTIGIRVEVSLRNKKYAGIVQSIFSEKPAEFTPAPILNILDNEPLLYPQQLKLWQWMAQYYMCAEGDIMQAAVPANFKLSSESILIWNDFFDDTDLSHLDEEEYLLAEALSIKKELRINEIQKILDSSHVYPIIKKLIEKNICFIWEELKQKYSVKKDTFITLHPNLENEKALEALLNNWGKAPKQLELLLAYLHLKRTEQEVTQSNLLKKATASAAQLKGLLEKNILVAEKRAVDRLPRLDSISSVNIELSEAQNIALQSIENSFQTNPNCLLHGVTSSGKTEIYIKLIEQYLQQDKQVLYMLPEIALTAQIINRLRKHFGASITIYHSKFSPNERVEIWNKVKSGEAKIVLGARSAILLPFQDLGLIIVDEEHDTSYKQTEPTPRYNARDTALYYATLFKAHVLLGSATPSLETFHNCEQKKYGYVYLGERYGNVQMPNIQILDLKSLPKEREERIIISPLLKEKVEQVLQQGKQVILFQNRRGYSPYIQCGTCGWIPECKNCNVSLTHHKHKNKLSCHYCGTEYPLIYTCPACGGHHFIQKNFGTEQIEEVVCEKFPEAHVGRMDLDSIRGKHDHEAIIQLFEKKKLDILIGTQMVVKGLDFENVQLVGVLDADSILNFADFRVNERAFQLLEQVSGRAGRRNEAGNVIIQVTNTHHPVLQFLVKHDYLSMYKYEINNRKMFNYPPFVRLIQVFVKHKDKMVAEEAANLLIEGLKYFKNNITGPAEPVINRIRNQYIWEILIKLPKDAKIIHNFKLSLLQQVAYIQNFKKYRGVIFMPDVDPN